MKLPLTTDQAAQIEPHLRHGMTLLGENLAEYALKEIRMKANKGRN